MMQNKIIEMIEDAKKLLDEKEFGTKSKMKEMREEKAVQSLEKLEIQYKKMVRENYLIKKAIRRLEKALATFKKIEGLGLTV